MQYSVKDENEISPVTTNALDWELTSVPSTPYGTVDNPAFQVLWITETQSPFTVSGYNFAIQYPIEIRVLPKAMPLNVAGIRKVVIPRDTIFAQPSQATLLLLLDVDSLLAMAQTHDDLFRHMSDVDYVDVTMGHTIIQGDRDTIPKMFPSGQILLRDPTDPVVYMTEVGINPSAMQSLMLNQLQDVQDADTVMTTKTYDALSKDLLLMAQ
ncbi:hypothetical protein SPFM12_00245 [Salmonella phage SPFM12]|nr:hypothetical protein SPFM12_00245 [Salmonella phage SPFM12]